MEEGWVEQELAECPKPYCWLSAELCCALQVFFIESVCNDPNVVATNVMVRVKATCFCFLLGRIFHLCPIGFFSKDILPDSAKG